MRRSIVGAACLVLAAAASPAAAHAAPRASDRPARDDTSSSTYTASQSWLRSASDGYIGTMAAADLDDDGTADVVAAMDTDQVEVYSGDGHGHLAYAGSVPVGDPDAGIGQVLTGDMNGDGVPDVVALDDAAGEFWVLPGRAGGLPGPASAPVALTHLDGDGDPVAPSITVADVDGDGLDDVVVAHYDSADVSVMHNDGDGHFTDGPPVPTGAAYTRQVAVADVNGDGRADLIAVDQCPTSGSCDSGYVAVLLGRPGGGYLPAAGSPYLTGSISPRTVQVADVNGDGHLDVVVGDSETSPVYTTVLLGDGTGRLQMAPGSPSTILPGYGSLLQYDGSGRAVGLVSGASIGLGEPRTLSLLSFDLAGQLTVATGSPQPVTSVAPPEDDLTDAVNVAGDFDGDGVPDLVGAYSDQFGSDPSYLTVDLTSTLPAPAVQVVAGTDPVAPGRATTLTARVQRPVAGTRVRLLDDGHPIGGACGGARGLAVSHQQVQCRVSHPRAGGHVITAVLLDRQGRGRRTSPALGLDVARCAHGLARCDLRGADLRGARLAGMRLRHADLRRADLRGADLVGTDLTGADLRGADLRWAFAPRADLHAADLAGAQLAHAQLREANLRSAALRSASIAASTLVQADLVGATGDPSQSRGAVWARTSCPDGSISSDDPNYSCASHFG